MLLENRRAHADIFGGPSRETSIILSFLSLSLALPPLYISCVRAVRDEKDKEDKFKRGDNLLVVRQDFFLSFSSPFFRICLS